MTHRNAYMTDELQAIYQQTVDFVAREVQPEGLKWEEDGEKREIEWVLGSFTFFLFVRTRNTVSTPENTRVAILR